MRRAASGAARTAHHRRSPIRWTSVRGEPGTAGQVADVVHADGRPAERRAAHASHTAAPPTRWPAGCRAPPSSTTTRPSASTSCRPAAAGRPGRRRCRRSRRPAARCASGPRRAAGRRRRGAGPRPRGPGLVDRLPHHVDAEDHVARRASAAVSRPGPQPRSTVWPRQRPSRARSVASASRRQLVHGQLLRLAAQPDDGAGLARSAALNTSVNDARPSGARSWTAHAATSPGRGEPRAGRQPRPPPPRPAPRRRRAGCRVVPTSRPAAVERGAGVGARSSAWTSARPTAPPRRPGSRSASTHQPPSSAGPRTASCSASPAAARSSCSAVTCGVSMPTCTTGPGHARVRVGQPGAEVAAPLRVHRPAGQRRAELVGRARPGSRSPARERWQRSGPTAAPQARERVQQRGGGDLGGALPCRSSAPSRVFTRPGSGRLGHDEHAGVHDSTRQKSRAARTVPRTEPDTFERVPSARGW